MFVTLDVQERGPDVQQYIMSPFVQRFQCGFHCFFAERNELSNRLQRFQLYHSVVPQCSTESAKKFSKTDGKVWEHNFDHLGAAYNKFHQVFVAMGLYMCIYIFFQIAVYLTTPKVLKSAKFC